MSCLPIHGRVDCKKCYSGDVIFNKSREGKEDDGWRITANPLAWGNPYAEVVVLGFSKGPTQAGSLENTPHDDIAFKGSRLNAGKIMAHVGLIRKLPDDKLKQRVDKLIANKDGRFHFGSLIRCTVERFDTKENKWKGSGGNILDKFVSTKFGQCVASNCTTKYLADLPSSTKLVLMFGLGTKLNYVKEAFKLFKKARPGTWRYLNDVAYTDEKITVVHVEHFTSQGAHIPRWLGEREHDRAKLGRMAQEAVASTINTDEP